MTEHNPYQWYTDLKKGAAREREEKEKNFRQFLNKLREESETESRATQELFYRALQEERDEKEKRKENKIARAMADAQAKAEKEAEQKFGIKTEKTKRLEDGLRQMLRGMKL